MEKMTIVNGVNGKTVEQLKVLKGDMDLRYLGLLTHSYFLEDAAGDFLQQLQREAEEAHRTLHIHFIPVESTTVPYAVGSNQNRHPWPRVGNLYYYQASGALHEEVLRPVARDEDITDVLVWCCLAAE